MKTKRVTFLLALFCMLSSYAIGQSISGEVRDAKTSDPVPGANVVVVGTTIGVVTDLDGKFTLTLPNGNKQIRISFIGYKDLIVDVVPGGTYNVSIQPEDVLLNEIVVVGYGTQKKVNLTGAVSTVDTKVLEARPIADVGRGLQGTTPGLSIVIPSGEIGSDPIMKIRGQFASIKGGSSPLILVDNIEIPSIQMLNPDDIESISVLKDAASSSIYGAKAAFGVILITTKKGAKTESVNVSYSNNFSFQNISKKMEMGGIDALEYTTLAFERAGGVKAGAFWIVTREGFEKAKAWQTTYGGSVKPNDPMVYGRDWYVDAGSNKIGLRTYDPYDYMIREWAPTQTHNLSVNGKSGKTDYNVALGYLDQEGIIKPSKEDNYNRYNGSVRIGTEITKNLKIHAGVLYSKRLKKYAYATNSTTADPWLYLYRWGPTSPFTTEDGEPLRSPAFEMSQANTASQEYNYASLNGGFTYTPLKNWNINFDYTHANQDYTNIRPGTRFTARNTWAAAVAKNDANGNRIYVNNAGEVVPVGTEGSMPAYQLALDTYTGAGGNPDHIYQGSEKKQWNTINLTTTYDLAVNEAHKAKLMLGMNSVGYERTDNWSQKTQLIDYSNPQFELASGVMTSGGGQGWDSQLGFFGRINYDFHERYLVEGNLRYDGSSKFPTELQWRYFPSFSLGWRLNEESWMKWSNSFMDALKLRGSWGSIGDQSVANNLYVPTLSGVFNSWLVSNNKVYQFGTPVAVSNSITWQDIVTLDLGVDARFFRNELGITVDWYRRDTKNMIVPQEGIPATFGAGAPQSNYGSLKTDGYEIQIDYNHSFAFGLGINMIATFSDAITTITKYGSTNSIDSWYVGKTYGEIWGYETDRLYQKNDFEYDSNGKLMLVDATDPEGVTRKVNKLSDPKGPTQGELQAGNFYFGPGDVKFKDLNGDGVINDGNKMIKNSDGLSDVGDLKVIGNSTPRYLYSLRLGFDFKGIDASVFMQGVGKREIWGDGFLAIPGYNSADGAMPQAIAGNFWREDRTDAFYPAPYNMANNNKTLNMQIQSRYLLNMAYLRIQNITLGYTFPTSLLNKLHITKVRVYGALENFFTFDHLGDLPIDPEVISGYSMWNDENYNASRTGVGVPAYKSASVGLQLNF